MSEDRLIRIEAKLDGLVTDVSVLKTDVAVLKTDVEVLKTNVSTLTEKVSGLEISVSEVRDGMDVMAADIHRLGVLQEAAHADAKVPFESDAGLREYMDRQFELNRRELREALAPLTLAVRAHTDLLSDRHDR
jgi:outer membrane murein-binding lipoprotein Lpp